MYRFLPGAYAVNGFHVHAVGWVLVFNMRALSQQEADELSELWGALLRAHADDKRKAPPLLRLMQPRSIALSEESVAAFARLVDRMATLHPERFGRPALRVRRNYWGLEAGLSIFVGALAAMWLPKAFPLVREAILTLFLLGCAFLVPTVILWRATAAVKQITVSPYLRCNGSHSFSSRSARSDEGRESVGAPDRSSTSRGRNLR